MRPTMNPSPSGEAGGGEEAARAPAMLVVARGPHLRPGTEFPLSEKVTALGRRPASGIALDDVTVSPTHAEIRRDGRLFMLLDHGSLNGTYVNRQPVGEAALADGDEIQVGKFRLIFRVAAGQEP